ncbi:MAG: ATP synthase F1 subunit delta [Bdellovibrionia bacterium]
MSVAKAYAKALYEAAAEGKSQADLARACDEIEAQLTQFVSIMSSSKEAQVAFASPVTTSKDKVGLVQAVTAKVGFSPMVSHFISMLAGKGRLEMMPEVRDVFADVRLNAEGGVTGKLVSAEPMTDADVRSLADAFSRKLGRKVAFRVSTDPSLLAGVRVTVSGVTYDGTLKAQLEQLRDKISTASVTA